MTTTFAPPQPFNTAVLFLVFNRPDTTARVFEAIRQAKPPRLYVAADGPRADRAGEAEKVARVREIATAVDWPCELRTMFRDHNIGCQLGPRTGIDWFFEHEDRGIILEDDCLPSQSFFWFCEQMLDRYKECDRVMAITGTNIADHLKFESDYFYSRYALMWGWATWKRAWRRYDAKLSDWRGLKDAKWLRGLGLGGLPFVRTWSNIFDRTVQLGTNATWWDYQWIYSCWVNDGLTIAPAKNLIRNIGYSPEATHTKSNHPVLANLISKELCSTLRAPLNFAAHVEADAFISRHWFGSSWRSLTKSVILKMPGAKLANEIRRKIC
jgi:hypothetical protein